MSLNNEILNAITSRRSCRAYQPQQKLKLDAVTAASSLGSGSCWGNRVRKANDVVKV